MQPPRTLQKSRSPQEHSTFPIADKTQHRSAKSDIIRVEKSINQGGDRQDHIDDWNHFTFHTVILDTPEEPH